MSNELPHGFCGLVSSFWPKWSKQLSSHLSLEAILADGKPTSCRTCHSLSCHKCLIFVATQRSDQLISDRQGSRSSLRSGHKLSHIRFLLGFKSSQTSCHKNHTSSQVVASAATRSSSLSTSPFRPDFGLRQLVATRLAQVSAQAGWAVSHRALGLWQLTGGTQW
jgi:hypothetical protein